MRYNANASCPLKQKRQSSPLILRHALHSSLEHKEHEEDSTTQGSAQAGTMAVQCL